MEYVFGKWEDLDANFLATPIGSPSGQTTWEYLTLFLVLVTYGYEHRALGLAILGDNLSSLNLSISLKGSAALGRISRELAWRRVRGGWRYACGHLPAELNDIAESLSRRHAPGDRRREFPAELRDVRRRLAVSVRTLWTHDL